MERILILKFGAIGDVIHSLPVLSTLRQEFPESHIAWAVEETAYPILEGNQNLNEVILLERKRLNRWSGLIYMKQWLGEIRGKSFNVVLDLHNLLKSGIVAYASRAQKRIGFRKFREGNYIFMTDRIQPEDHHRHATDKYLSLLKAIGIDEAKWDRQFPMFWGREEEQFIDQLFKEHRHREDEDWVIINPGGNWASKRWMPERYAAVGDGLARACGVRVMVLWGPGELELAKTVCRLMREGSILTPMTTIKQVMALIIRCRLFISGDTGPLHIAAALKIPTLSLFGPSDPGRNGPYGRGHRVIQSPIGPAGHFQRKEHGEAWLNAIDVKDVLPVAIEQLNGRREVENSSPK